MSVQAATGKMPVSHANLESQEFSAIQRPLYDATRPDVEALLLGVVEHAAWDELPSDAIPYLSGSSDLAAVHKQLAVQSAADIPIRHHTLQVVSEHSRAGAFMLSAKGSIAIIGGEAQQFRSVKREDMHSGLQDADGAGNMERILRDVVLSDLAARAGSANNSKRQGHHKDGLKKVNRSRKSEVHWDEEEALGADHSSVSGHVEMTQCSANLVLVDVAASMRFGKSCTGKACPLTYGKSARTDSATVCDGMLLVYSARIKRSGHTNTLASVARVFLSVIHFSAEENKSREALPLTQCSYASTSPDHSQCSKVWCKQDLIPSSVVQSRARLVTKSIPVTGAEGVQSCPLSGMDVTQLAVYKSGNCVLVLSASCKDSPHWEVATMRPTSDAPEDKSIIDVLTLGRDRMLISPAWVCSGRPISRRYTVLTCCIHDGCLIAIVSPDTPTAISSPAPALRVYSLHLASRRWAIVSPSGRDAPGSKYPLPRVQAAVCPHRGKLYLHGGVSLATGHGCLNDLWSFDVTTRQWELHSTSGDRCTLSKKVASLTTAPLSGYRHAMAMLDNGACVLYGGQNNKQVPTHLLQVLFPLATQIPGGVPTGVPPALTVPLAPLFIGLAHVRSRVARAVLRTDSTTVVIETRGTTKRQLITAPVRVLQLYSKMICEMADGGIFEDAAVPPVIPANPRHSPEAVSLALRWAMGLVTLLASDVYTCAAVLSVADYFIMPPLRMEALSLIACKAQVNHLPMLQDLASSLTMHELDPCIDYLHHEGKATTLSMAGSIDP